MSQHPTILDALPAIIKNANADLPENYKRARAAIQECASVDEVATWANKAAAMATYAREIRDNSLKDAANRIQCRAMERLGEMLIEVAGTLKKRKEYAASYGISATKVSQASAIAAVPKPALDELIEASPAPTPSQLVYVTSHFRRRPTQNASRIVDKSIECDYIVKALINDIREAASERCLQSTPETMARHVKAELSKLDNAGASIDSLLADTRTVIDWLQGFEKSLSALPRKVSLKPRCAMCGKDFTPGHRKQVYCSSICTIRATRQRAQGAA